MICWPPLKPPKLSEIAAQDLGRGAQHGIVADGALRGAGDTRWPFLIRCTLAWGVFVPLAWLLGVHLDLGLTWAWSAGCVYVALLTGALVLRFRGGAWRRIRI